MLLWVGFAVLTAAVVAALLRPMMRGEPSGASRSGDAAADVAVYRDQLSEIDADKDRGLISPDEAEAARAELARRLLRAADEHSGGGGVAQAGSAAPSAVTVPLRTPVYIVGAIVPFAAIAIYLGIGSPDIPGQPHTERVRNAAAGRSSVDDLVGLVEKRLREHPDDGQGWDVIGPVYMKTGKFRAASNAYANAARLLGETPDRLLGLAEALIMANNGLVVEDARKVLVRVRTLDAVRPEPSFWLAIAKEQDGDVQGAIGELDALLKMAPPEAEWKATVEKQIAALKARATEDVAAQSGSPGGVVAGSGSGAVAPKAAPAPTAGEVAAAGAMTPEQRTAMIDGMVRGLAERLDRNGRDLEGWLRLARAYKVLGRDADARTALAKARQNFASDATALRSLDDLALALGLGS